MSARALAPSPVARRLFELAERRADGTLDVGGRTIALRRGRIVDVGAADSDESLVEFMVRAGRIDAGLAEEASRRARAKSIDIQKALGSVGVRSKEIESARRAMFLDRLVRGLGQAELDATGPSPFAPDATHSETDEGEDLSALVLDALERRAGEHDAGLVGERASEIVHFVEGPFLELARKYVSQPDAGKPPAVFEILRRSPAAASRIAALVRAGLVLLQPEQHGAPPPKRPKSIAPAPAALSIAPRAPTASTASIGPRFRDTLRPGVAPAREPVMRLEPGMTALEPHEFAGTGDLPIIPPFVGPLADPLDAPERAVAQLEQAQAPGRERAQAWLAFGRAWLRHCASIDEAARCAREAAAADASNLVALRESTQLCAAMGRVDLARAYARATVHYAQDDEGRSEGLLDLARLAERDGDINAALAALEEATRFPSGSIEAWQRLAQLAYARSDVERAVRAAVGGAEAAMPMDPTIARAWAEWAQMLAGNAEAASVEARAIERLGRGAAASAILAARARAPFDVATRQRLLLEAAEIAERAGRDDLAFMRALDAHFADPAMEALYEPLLAYGSRALDRGAYAALVEHLANVAPAEAKREWFSRAADAFEESANAESWALELRTRAMLAEPPSDDALGELRAHAERAKDPAAYADGIERLVRSGLVEDPVLLSSRLVELADYSESVLGSAPRALAALVQANAVSPDPSHPPRIERLEARVRIGDEVLGRVDQELSNATEEQSPAIARRLAGLVRDLPDARERAIAIYRQLLAFDPTDASAALGLERLLAIMGEDEERRLLFAARAPDESGGPGGTRRYQHWAGLAALAGEWDDAIAANDAWLALDPNSGEAAFRIELSGRMSGDIDLRRAALEHRLEASGRNEERAQILVERGLLERTSGDASTTVAFADQARILDPNCVDASVVLLEELARLEPASALEVVEAARALLGDTPQLLLVAADLATSVGDDARRRALLDARCAIAQDAPSVAQLRVDRAIEEGDPNTILAAAQQALARDAIVAGTPLVIERALEVVAAHDPGDAATVAIHAADRLGESRFAELALRYAEQSGLPERSVAALERWVAWSSGGARCVHLRSLAATHRETGNRAAEARTWLRLLADDPKADDACERLAQLYAETRDAERLLAVLAIRLENATNAEQRESRLFHLAAASVLVVEDVERAEGFLRRLVTESDDPIAMVARSAAALVTWDLPARAIEWLLVYAENAADQPAETLFAHATYVAEEILHSPERTMSIAAQGLRRFPGSTSLLLAFERGALATKSVDAARDIYALVESSALGEHGRRGFVYRRARFLERAGAKDLALDAYLDAFSLQPGEGVVLQAIERLANELGRHDRWVDATLALIERTQHLDRRLALLRHVATVCEHRLHDPGRAFGLVFDFWRSTQRSDLLADVRRLARAIATKDAARADAATAEVVATLTARVDDAWDAEDQIRCLRIIATMEKEDRADLTAAFAAADRGIRAARESSDIDVSEAAELACDAAEWALEAKDGRARSFATAALELSPDLERVKALMNLVAAMPSSSPQAAAAPSGPATPAAAEVAATSPHPATATPASPEDQLFARAAALADDPTRARERAFLLRDLLRLDPSRTDVYVSLVEAARLADLGPLAETAAAIGRHFDDAISPPTTEFERSRPTDSIPSLIRGASDPAMLEVLSLLWDSVLPLQRRTLAHYGLSPSERIDPESNRASVRLLGVLANLVGQSSPALFVRTQASQPIALLPTQPPTLVVRSDLEEEEQPLAHYLAWSLATSTPDSMFVSVFTDEQGRGMMSAIVAAFGAHELVRDVPREAAAIAAELWHVVPQKRQSDLRAALAKTPELFDWNRAADAVASIGARAALVTGSVGLSLDALARFDVRVRPEDLTTEERFAAAVRSSRPLAALVRESLADEILACRVFPS